MKNSLIKRLEEIEKSAVPTASRVIGCYNDEELEKLAGDWLARNGEITDDHPLILMRRTVCKNKDS